MENLIFGLKESTRGEQILIVLFTVFKGIFA
jgi:hypothetical protein